jgi:two-component system chemotaxis response regulator CheY
MSQQRKVLIAGEDATIRSTVRSSLLELGSGEVTEAGDIDAAMSLLRAGDFAFVVAAVNSPKFAGLALLKAVPADSRLATLQTVCSRNPPRQDR